MSDINITKFLLDLEDENLIPDGNPFTSFITLPNGITAKLLQLKSTTPFIIRPECGQILSNLHDYRKVHIKHYTCGKQPLLISIRKKSLNVQTAISKSQSNSLWWIKTASFPMASKEAFSFP